MKTPVTRRLGKSDRTDQRIASQTSQPGSETICAVMQAPRPRTHGEAKQMRATRNKAVTMAGLRRINRLLREENQELTQANLEHRSTKKARGDCRECEEFGDRWGTKTEEAQEGRCGENKTMMGQMGDRLNNLRADNQLLRETIAANEHARTETLATTKASTLAVQKSLEGAEQGNALLRGEIGVLRLAVHRTGIKAKQEEKGASLSIASLRNQRDRAQRETTEVEAHMAQEEVKWKLAKIEEETRQAAETELVATTHKDATKAVMELLRQKNGTIRSQGNTIKSLRDAAAK